MTIAIRLQKRKKLQLAREVVQVEEKRKSRKVKESFEAKLSSDFLKILSKIIKLFICIRLLLGKSFLLNLFRWCLLSKVFKSELTQIFHDEAANHGKKVNNDENYKESEKSEKNPIKFLIFFCFVPSLISTFWLNKKCFPSSYEKLLSPYPQPLCTIEVKERERESNWNKIKFT